MGFVGGGGNIAIATAIPPSSIVHCIIKHQIVYEFSLSYIYACLRLRFLDVETIPGQRRPIPDVCRILSSNVRDLARNLRDLTVVSSQYDILLCSETLVSDMRHVSEFLFFLFFSGIRSPCVLLPGQDTSGTRDGCIRTKWFQSISPTQI